MQKITPFLWFDGKAEEAINFYASIFKNSKVTNIRHWGEGSPYPKSQVMSATVVLDGIQFHAFDAGPVFKFTEAISFFITCRDQEEVDYYWSNLIAGGGEESMCGWLKDKFGVSWQVVPDALNQLMYSKDAAKAQRVMAALMKMKRIIIADLEKAHDID
jgi:predicted 3-demethylubiquinone-9 3-methyltransferase (glyoxalase superfamily)